MSGSVQEVLEARSRALGRVEIKRSLAVALALHAALTAGLLVVPALVREPPPPVRFVAVQIVPARALGVEGAPPAPRPAPPLAAPRPTPAPAAEPLRPAPDDTPRLPAAKPAPPAAPAAAPTSAQEAGVTGGEVVPVSGSPTGVPGGLALGAAVAGVDNPSFTYGYYLDQMLALVHSQWVRPPLGSGVEATVSFRIQRDGRVSDLRVERSSGYSSFDLAALRSVQAASPLLPLPRGYTHPSLGVNLIFR